LTITAGRSWNAPRSVEEAVAHLADFGDEAGIVAGGTDLVVASRAGRRSLPKALVSIRELQELSNIEEADGSVRLGGLVTFADLEASELIRHRYTALSDAAALVGSPATRHLGTIGGNLCNGSPAMESGSPLLVFEGVVALRSKQDARSLDLEHFLVGPSQTALRPGELLIGVSLPPHPQGQVGSAYVRLEYRAAMEIAVVGAAALVVLDPHGRCSEARIALTAVAPTCVRAREAEAELHGKVPTPEALVAAADHAAHSAHPIDDVRAPARYRAAMVPVIVGRALELAARRAAQATP
jgi:aerobic carbon-monoxide dehydrogenase medium subunit